MFKKNKKIILIATLVLIVCISVGTTVAYIIDKTYAIKNTFESTEVTTTINEKIHDSKVKKSVTVSNTGEIDAWIRAEIIINWKDADGNVYGKAVPVEKKDYSIVIGEEWLLGEDGFYYWPNPITPKGETGALIESCENIGNAPEGYYLSVEIIGSGLQSKPVDVFEKVWKSSELSVNNDGTAIEVKQ